MLARITRRAAAPLLTILALGCSGKSNTAPSTLPTPTPPVCTQTLIAEGSGSIPADTLGAAAFTTSSAGRLDVILDWTFADSQIGLYVVRGSCSLEQFNARTCDFVLRSEPTPAKPRRVSASNVPAGSYSQLVANYSHRDESLSTQIFLRSEACPPVATNGEGGAAPLGSLRRALPF